MMSKIMVIDDDDAVRDFIVRILEKIGHTATGFLNGNDALASFTKFQPDLVITDMVMPGKEGLETILEIKKISPNLAIIAMSGGTQHLNTKNLLKVATHFGAVEVLSKPFSLEELRAALAKVGILPAES